MIIFGGNVVESLWDETRLLKFQVLILVLPCMVHIFSVPQCPHLLNEDHNIISYSCCEGCFNTCYGLRTLCGRCAQTILAVVIHEPGYRAEKVGDLNLVAIQLIKLDTNTSAILQAPLFPLKSIHQIYIHGPAK